MPCMDYDDRWRSDAWRNTGREEARKEMKEHTDKLARIACKATLSSFKGS